MISVLFFAEIFFQKETQSLLALHSLQLKAEDEEKYKILEPLKFGKNRVRKR